MIQCTMSERSYHRATSRSCSTEEHRLGRKTKLKEILKEVASAIIILKHLHDDA